MQIKLIEIRDKATFIPAMAVRLLVTEPYTEGSQEFWLLRRAGYAAEQIAHDTSDPYILLIKLDGVEAEYDPFAWSNQRTMGNAHRELIDRWPLYSSGDVLDIEFVLGEVLNPKESERKTA